MFKTQGPVSEHRNNNFSKNLNIISRKILLKTFIESFQLQFPMHYRILTLNE